MFTFTTQCCIILIMGVNKMLFNRIKSEREQLGLTQSDLSKKLNVSQQTIGSWEVGRTEPSTENLQKLSELFNTSIDYLLGKSNLKNPESLNIDEDLRQILNNPDTLVAFKDFNNLPDTDKQEIINFIKFKKQQSN